MGKFSQFRIQSTPPEVEGRRGPSILHALENVHKSHRLNGVIVLNDLFQNFPRILVLFALRRRNQAYRAFRFNEGELVGTDFDESELVLGAARKFAFNSSTTAALFLFQLQRLSVPTR